MLEQLARIGYDGVELAGFADIAPAELRAILEAEGLRAISAHVPLAHMRRDMEQVIAQYAMVGCRYLAVPRLDAFERPGGAGFAQTLREMHRFGQRAKQAGMTLLFHNHYCEFERVSSQCGLDFMYDTIGRDVLQTQLDVCWIAYAGQDPIAYLKRYAGRIPVVHLKDFQYAPGDISPYELQALSAEERASARVFAFCPWGAGNLDAADVMRAAVCGGADWFVVEQDEPYQGTALENAAQSMDTIRRIYRQF